MTVVQRCQTSAKWQCTQTLQISIRWVRLMRWMMAGNKSDARHKVKTFSRRLVMVHCAHQRNWLLCLHSWLYTSFLTGSERFFFYEHCFTSFQAICTRNAAFPVVFACGLVYSYWLALCKFSFLADLVLVGFSGCKRTLVSRVYITGLNVNVLQLGDKSTMDSTTFPMIIFNLLLKSGCN